MTKHLRISLDAIKDNRIKEKDGIRYVECKTTNENLFINNDEQEEFLTKIKKLGFKDYEAMPVMDKLNTSRIHHYEIRLK